MPQTAFGGHLTGILFISVLLQTAFWICVTALARRRNGMAPDRLLLWTYPNKSDKIRSRQAAGRLGGAASQGAERVAKATLGMREVRKAAPPQPGVLGAARPERSREQRLLISLYIRVYPYIFYISLCTNTDFGYCIFDQGFNYITSYITPQR